MFFSRKPAKPSAETLNLAEKLNVLESIYQTQAVAEFSTEGMVITANSLYHDMFGCSDGSLVNRPHKELCHTKDVNSPEYASFWQKLAAGTLVNGQFRRKRADGKTIWLDATYAPIRDNSGQVTKVVKIAHDVTSLMEENNRFTDAFKAVERSMAVIEFDCNGIIQRANDNFLAATGYPATEILGKHHRIFVPEEDTLKPEYEQFWKNLADGKFFSDRFRRVRKDGTDLWLEASYTPLISSEGDVYGVVKFATDITSNVQKALTEKERAASAYHITSATEQSASTGTDIIQQASDEMTKVSAAVSEAATVISELGAQSDMITSIVNTIRGIADQTNLLALNAAIEAARAGDQGRGFAVVADEVRQLAARTSSSTEEISQMINKMQSGTSRAIQSMESCQHQAGEGVALATRAGEMILEIRQGTREAVNAVSIFNDSLH
ncbi:MAG: chemotaxis protein [Oceanospirillaceae bacterium]|nr:PAS domain-containing methyl-accepting chemotaxis protein [Thalassolituus sp. UBA3500]MBN58642.1 chemotaxis protein [Oceanospirillaceae bacterium]